MPSDPGGFCSGTHCTIRRGWHTGAANTDRQCGLPVRTCDAVSAKGNVLPHSSADHALLREHMERKARQAPRRRCRLVAVPHGLDGAYGFPGGVGIPRVTNLVMIRFTDLVM